jgi:hypothetical protein
VHLRCQSAKGTSEPPIALEPEPTTSSKRNSDNDQEQDPAPKRMKVSGKSSIKDFMDQLDSQTKEEIDISIVKFFYQSGINSNAIESSFLKHAMKKLRTSYTLPSVNEIDKELEDKVYNELLSTVRPEKPEKGTLILSVDEFDEVSFT